MGWGRLKDPKRGKHLMILSVPAYLDSENVLWEALGHHPHKTELCPLFLSQILQLWDLLSCSKNLEQVLLSVSWMFGLWPSVFKCAVAGLACLFCALRTFFGNAFLHLLFSRQKIIAGSQFSKPSLSHTTLHHILNCNFSTDLKGMWAHTQLAVHAKLFSWAKTGGRIDPEPSWGLARFYFLELIWFLLTFSLKKTPTALQEFILHHKKIYVFCTLL